MGFSAPTPPPAPPSCSDCATKTQPAGGGQPTQSSSRMWRSSDGKMRIDTPNTSVISDPTSQKTIMLDHLKKEAIVMPTPPKPPGATLPGMPQAPGAPGQPPQMQVQDLGKSTIEGHPVEGKKYTLPSMPQPPKPPMPQMPPKPQMPGAPSAPQASAPQAPAPPKLPTGPSTAEVWTSSSLKTPVLTKVTTPAGEQTTYCKPTSTAEPPASMFQIPPGYKLKPPTMPKPPSVQAPKPPAPPSAPNASAPSAPSVQPPKLPKF